MPDAAEPDRLSPAPLEGEPTRPDDLVLYATNGCGYCADVRHAARSLGLELEERDAWGDPHHRAELMAARGRRTVPVLRIRGEEEDRWMGESADIIAYLRRRFGDGRAPSRIQRMACHPGIKWAMWGLLVLGGVTTEPTQSIFWTAACIVAAARSFSFALTSRAPIHAMVGAAFTLGAVSIALHGLGIAELPWWYAAFAIVAVAALSTWARTRRSTTAVADS